jgi:hypothetical protein
LQTCIIMRQWGIIAKPYQVVPCLITPWSLIILSSLNPMVNFVHLIHLFICAPWVHRVAHAFVSLLLNDFTKSTNLFVSSPLLVHGTNPSSPCMTALSLKRRRHEHAFSWPPCELCLIPYAGNPTVGSLLTGWQVVQIATLPWIVPIRLSASQARIYKMESVISLRSGKKTKL